MTLHPVARDRRYEAGQVILCEDTAGAHLYIVKRGRVRVVKRARGGETVLDEFGPGSIFGEMALIDSKLRSASVVAVAPTVCLELPRALVADHLGRAGPLIGTLLRLLVLRLRTANTALGSLRERTGDSGEIAVDKITERHLKRLVRKLDDDGAQAWEKMGEP